MQQTQVNKSATQIHPKQAERKCGFYEKYIKRLLDIICSLAAIIVFSWLYIIVAVLVRVKLGPPILFKQLRPGKVDSKTGQESIFYVYKFRSMSDERDENGNLLPDEVRLGKFGRALRATSLDELPEAFNILKGDMSIIGPRPQLVRDMVFMTDEQRRRHTVRPGLSGLAQVNGRNTIKWEDRLDLDLEYIKKISFIGDLKIIFATVKNAIFRHEGVNENGMATSEDFGDYFLRTGRITKEEYDAGINKTKEMINEFEQEIRI